MATKSKERYVSKGERRSVAMKDNGSLIKQIMSAVAKCKLVCCGEIQQEEQERRNHIKPKQKKGVK